MIDALKKKFKEGRHARCRCYGLIQWIRIEVVEGVRYENHPSLSRPVSNWQHTREQAARLTIGGPCHARPLRTQW